MSTEKEDRRSSHRRRWPWVLGGIVVLLGALVFSLPYIASTGWGENLVAGIVADALNGEVTLEDLSTSWTGPTRIRGFVLKDKGGRQRIAIQEASVSRGVWGLMWTALA